MASATPANMMIVSVLAVSLPIHGLYRAYKFDGMKCLIPDRKHAVRTGMLWAMMLSSTFFSAWAIGLCLQKYRLGFISLPEPYGILPYPITIWSKKELDIVFHWDICILIAFSLYDAVNLEEALYWIFLLRSVHRSRNGRIRKIEHWASSRIFVLYVVLALLTTFGHVGAVFIGTVKDESERSIRLFCMEGGSAVFNVVLSVALAYYLPPFIKTVGEKGASPDVLNKLIFFKELNLLRCVLRTVFAAGALALGIDASSEKKRLLLNPFANDCIFMALAIAFWQSLLISQALYLPISFYAPRKGDTALTRRRNTARNPYARNTYRRGSFDGKPALSDTMTAHSMEHKTLVALMRERGAIHENEKVPEDYLFDEMDDEAAGIPKETRVGTHGGDLESDPSFIRKGDVDTYPPSAPESSVDGSLASSHRTRPASFLPKTMRKSYQSDKSQLPAAVQRFAGPFAGIPAAEAARKQEVVVHIAQEVEVRDDGPQHGRI